MDLSPTSIARRLAPVAAVAMATAGLAVVSAPAAQAAGSITYTVTSTDDTPTAGADCTGGGTCTLLDAITLANAVTSSDADDVKIVFDDSLDGETITSTNALMENTSLDSSDNIAVAGARYFIHSGVPVTVDFGNEVSMETNDAGYALFALASPDITIENFPKLMGGEGVFAVMADNATIKNGHCEDETVDTESCIGIANGVLDGDGVPTGDYTGNVVHNLTVTNLVSNLALGNLYVIKVANGSTLDGATVTGSTFGGASQAVEIAPDASLDNTTFSDNTFAPTGDYMVFQAQGDTTNLKVDGNTFTNTSYVWQDWAGTSHVGLQFTDNQFVGQLGHAFLMDEANYKNTLISGNSFTKLRGGVNATIDIVRNVNAQPDEDNVGNVIDGNTFDQTGADDASKDRWAIWFDNNAALGQSTGWAFPRNDITGYLGATEAPITVSGAGTTEIWGNTYGAGTRPSTDAADAESAGHSFLWNNGANNRIQTWRPAAVSFHNGKITFTAAPVDPASPANNQPAAGPVTLYVYWTDDDRAEEYLGKITDVAAAGKFTVDSDHTGGHLRLQTEDSAGNFSMYSGESEAAVDWATLDDDGDGLTNGQEVQLGTDPAKADTDGDGIKDGAEVNGTFVGCANGTNPLKADTDGDGLKDGAEVKGFDINQKNRKWTGKKITNRNIGHVTTSPCRADTDGDGIKDKRELQGFKIHVKVVVKVGKHHFKTVVLKGRVFTNPMYKDTDHDGLTDKQELTGSKNKRFHHHVTSPVNMDADHDGVKDRKETRQHTNPNNGRSHR